MSMNAKWRNQPVSDRIFDVINWIFMAIIFVVCVYPLYYVVIASVNDGNLANMYIWPESFTFDGYKAIFEDASIWCAFGYSIFYTVSGVVVALCVTIPAAYALSRRDFVGRGLLMGMVTVTMFVSGGMIPGYLNNVQLGLVDQPWAIALFSACSAYNLIVARTFFQTTIPGELLEAAKIDGCGNGNFFFQIVLPLSKPILAVIALYVGVGRWNSYMSEMINLRNEDFYPISMVLRRLLDDVETLAMMISDGALGGAGDKMEEKLRMATVMQYCLIVVSTVPMMVVYPFMQKYFAKGVMIGSVKG